MADTQIRAVITAKDEASSVVSGFTNSLNSAKLGSLALLGGVVAMGAGLASTVKSFEESQNVAAQLDAVLRSTAGAAGVTSQAAIALSKSLESQTTFSDEAVLSVENLLLTFTAIGKDIFPQATKTVLDMATALGEDTKSASIQLGKALQDPILGITALRRVGVNFSDAQKDVIQNLVETGQKAKAQQLILKELNTEFGGSASAAANTFQGRIKQLGNAFDDMKEIIGGTVVEALQPLVNKVLEFVDKSGGAEGVVAKLSGLFQTWKPLIEGVAVAIGVGLVASVVALGVAVATNPITWFVGIIAGLGFVITKIIEHFGGWNQTMLAMHPIVNALRIVWTEVATVFSQMILPALQAMWTSFQAQLLPALQRLWALLAPVLIPVLKDLAIVMAGVLLTAILATIGIISALIQYLSTLVNALVGTANAFKSVMSAIGSAVYGMYAAVSGQVSALINLFRSLPGIILGAVSGFGGLLYNAGRDLIQGLINGIGSLGGAVGDKVKGIANGAVDKAKSILGIHSPSTVFHEIGTNIGQGLINGLNASAPDVSAAVEGMTSTAAPTATSSSTGYQQTVVQPAAPTINLSVNVGVYAGTEIEKRKLAQSLWGSLQDIATAKNMDVLEMLS